MADPKLSSRGSKPLPFCNSLSNIQDFGFGQFCTTVGFTFWVSAFFNSILNIFLVCTKKKMSRVYAAGSIAFMAYTSSVISSSFRNFTKCKLPSNSMCKFTFLFNIKVAISPFVFSTPPQPTLIGQSYINPIPKKAMDITMSLVLTFWEKRIVAFFTNTCSKMKSHFTTSNSRVVKGVLATDFAFMPFFTFNPN